MSAAAALAVVDDALGVAAPLPRSNGELVFEEVWQGSRARPRRRNTRAHGRGMERIRDHLVAAIAAHEPAPGESAATAYYTAWLDAIEALLAARGLT